MAVENVLDSVRKPLLDLACDIHNSLVYLDAGATEVVQLSLGSSFLFGLGAANVCDLERCHPDDTLLYRLANSGTCPTSVVVLTTQLLPDVHQHMVHLLMVHHQVKRCTMFCAVSELAHAQLDPSISSLGVEAYSEYISALRQDLALARAAAGLPAPREEQLQLAVQHLPLHVVAIDSNTFVLPAAGAVASRAIAGGHAAGYASVDTRSDDAHDDRDAIGVSTGLSLLSHSLADISRLLGARLDPYAIGPVSMAVASELAALPQVHRGPTSGDAAGGTEGVSTGRPGTSGHHTFLGPGNAGFTSSTAGNIGLVLIDRSLDLATPCMHGDHVLDAIFAHSPRAAEAVVPVSGAPGGAVTQHGRRRVGIRPADYRLDVPPLAPLAPLTPPPLHTRSCQHQQLQQPSPGSDHHHDYAVTASAAAAAAVHAPLAAPMGLSLFHPADQRWLTWLQQLWPKRNKDALLLLRKWLKEALRAERISPSTRSKLSSVVAPAELLNLAQCLMRQPDVFSRHQPIVGLALAAAAALASDVDAGGAPAAFWSQWERCADLERQLLLSLPDGSQGAAMLKPVLLEAIESTKKGRLSIDHMLQLLVTVYSLSGDRMPPAPPLYSADEAEIKQALAEAIMTAAQQHQQQGSGGPVVQLECLPGVQQLLHQVHDSSALSSGADFQTQLMNHLHAVFQRLRWLAATRGKLRDVRRLMQVDVDTGAASSCTSLVRQVLTKILLQADNRDLQQPENASLVAGLLHRGLGRLGFSGISGAARSSISEYSTILIFIVGGISPAEVRDIRQELEEHKFGHKPLVLLGGTSWLTARDAARFMLS